MDLPPSPALPQANPGTNLSLNDPPPAPHPHGPGQPSASRPPGFDQYRASSQGGCKLHPPRRPQLSRGHMGEGVQPGSGLRRAESGQGSTGKASLAPRVICCLALALPQSFSSQILSEHQPCTRCCCGLLGHSEGKSEQNKLLGVEGAMTDKRAHKKISHGAKGK